MFFFNFYEGIMQPIKIKINNYRAIKSADIDFNGVTVVCGDNGSGKSTLSRLLYYSFKYANIYDVIVDRKLQRDMGNILSFIHILHYELPKSVTSKVKLPLLFTENDLFDISLDSYIQYLYQLYSVLKEGHEKYSDVFLRYKHIIENQIQKQIWGDEDSDLSFLVKLTADYVVKLKRQAEFDRKERPYNLYEDRLWSATKGFIDGVSIKEFGTPILEESLTTVRKPTLINKVVYIDTPMILELSSIADKLPVEHWRDTFELLKSMPSSSRKNIITNSISKDISQIIGGDAYYSSGLVKGFFFDSLKSDLQIDIELSASGIKSFSIIKILVDSGMLNRNTLLIIDEPEAHLHPQWIVEYARILIQIRKRLGVWMFIASHSTDMVSALRYIAEKQRLLDDVTFYMTEEDQHETGKYNYKNTGTEIEPQFESFNKSLDKLDEYGSELQ